MLRALMVFDLFNGQLHCLAHASDDPSAYPLTKTELRRAVNRSCIMIVFTMFFSGGIIPEYILVKELHMLKPFGRLSCRLIRSIVIMITLISFVHLAAKSLEESAEIDGSSHFGTLVRIILPLSCRYCDA